MLSCVICSEYAYATRIFYGLSLCRPCWELADAEMTAFPNTPMGLLVETLKGRAQVRGTSVVLGQWTLGTRGGN